MTCASWLLIISTVVSKRGKPSTWRYISYCSIWSFLLTRICQLSWTNISAPSAHIYLHNTRCNVIPSWKLQGDFWKCLHFCYCCIQFPYPFVPLISVPDSVICSFNVCWFYFKTLLSFFLPTISIWRFFNGGCPFYSLKSLICAVF